jgi:hypothetical protein
MTIPAGVTDIADKAFRDCGGLTNISIPSTVITIGKSTFKGCRALTSITVAKENPAYCDLDGVLFNKAATELIACPAGRTGPFEIPPTVTLIREGAFEGCQGLTAVTIPPGVVTIGDEAFLECSSLAEIRMGRPSSLASIGNRAFESCVRLTEVTIPADTGYRAFFGCRILSRIMILAGVTEIGGHGFDGCDKLRDIVFEGDSPRLGESVFVSSSPNIHHRRDKSGFSSEQWRFFNVIPIEETSGPKSTIDGTSPKSTGTSPK